MREGGDVTAMEDTPPCPLPTLGYGAANLGNLFRAIDDAEAWAIMEAAWDAGIRLFDTAPHYGLGESERRLGAFLRTKPRGEFIVSTKAGRLLRPNPEGAPDYGGLDLANGFHVPATLRRQWDFSEAGIRASLDESLERMGLDRVDVLYLHDPERHDLDHALAEGLPALAALRDQGRVRAIGVGSMVTDALGAAVEADTRIELLMVAGRYTLLDQAAVPRVMDACLERGTGVVAASVFNSGLLSTDAPARHGRYEYGQLPEELWERLQRLVAVCRSHDVPVPAAAVQFPLRHAAVSAVVVGGSKPSHIAQTAEWVRADIPESLWSELGQEGLISSPGAEAERSRRC